MDDLYNFEDINDKRDPVSVESDCLTTFQKVQCQVPVFRNRRWQLINLALVLATRKTAPPNRYRRKDECLTFLTMPDSRMVSVEKMRIISSFP